MTAFPLLSSHFQIERGYGATISGMSLAGFQPITYMIVRLLFVELWPEPLLGLPPCPSVRCAMPGIIAESTPSIHRTYCVSSTERAYAEHPVPDTISIISARGIRPLRAGHRSLWTGSGPCARWSGVDRARPVRHPERGGIAFVDIANGRAYTAMTPS